jgi:transposase-like protein
MGRQRRQFTGAFKAKLALEAIKGQRTVQELATGALVNKVVFEG